MSFIQDMMKQKCAYFAPLAPDQFGNPILQNLVPPIQLNCRWDDSTSNQMGNESEVTQSDATVYVDRDVAVHGRLLLLPRGGSVSSSTTSTGSWEIIDFVKTPRYTADMWVRKCLLRRG